MEIFKIWSSLDIKGNAVSEMERFLIAARSAGKHISALEKSLGLISKQFGSLNTVMMGSNIEFKGIGENISSLSRRTTGLIGKTDALAMSLKAVAASGVAATSSMMGGGRRGGGGGHIPIHGLREVGMGGIVGPASFMRSAGYAGGGALIAAAGAGILIHKGFESQKEFQQQLLQLKASGLTDAQVKEASGIAMTPTKGLSSIGKIKALNDAFMASRDWKEAKILAPVLAEAEFAGNTIFANMSDTQRKNLIRFAEVRSGSDMSKIPGNLNLGFKIMSATAGTLDPNQLAAFSRRAQTAGYMISKRGLAGLAPVMQELSGTDVGTSYQTGYQMLATGVGTLNNKKRVEDLLKLGIYKAGHMDSNGRYVSTQVDPALLKLYETSPVDFTKKILGIYAKNGTTSEEDINRRLSLDFPRKTSGLITNSVKNMGKIDREMGLFDSQMEIPEAFKASQKTAAGSSQSVANAWSAFTTAFGQLTGPDTIKGLNALTNALNFFTRVINTFANNTPKEFATKLVNTVKADSSHLPGMFGRNLAHAVGEPVKSQQPAVMQGVVYLDKRKVGDIMAADMHSQLNSAGTISSITSVNSSLSMTPVGLSNYGSQQ